MPTLAQAKQAIALYEAEGDTESANLIRRVIQQSEGGATPEPVGPSMLERQRQIQAEGQAKYAAARAAYSPPQEETGIFEDFTTGFGRGFVGVGESAALGLAALAEEETETQLRDRIKSVADSFAPEGGDPESFTSGLGSAFGSIAGIALPAAGLAALAPAAAATGVATGTAAALGVGAAAGEASERAREAGVSEEVRSAATLRGAPIGLLDVLPMARFVKSIDVPILSKLVDKLGPEQVNTIGEKVRSAALTGGYEAGQEVAAEALQNLNERQYNEAVEIFAGAGEAATFGGIAGGVLDLFLGRRARDIKPPPPAPQTEDIPEDAPVGTQGEMFPRGPVEGPSGREPLSTEAEAVKARLLDGLDTDSFDGVATLPDEQQLEFELRRQDLTRAEKDSLMNAARGVAPATVDGPLSQDVLPGMSLPVTEEIDTAMDAQLKAFSDEQLADALAPAGTQLELGEVPRADQTVDLPEDSVDVEEVRERVFKGFSASARSKPLNELTAKQQQRIAKRAQALAPAELAALEEVLAQEAVARPTTEVQEPLPGVEPEKVGPQLQGLPAPESEAIAGETVAITSEGEALTGEQLLERRQQQATERAEQDAERVTQEAVIGDMPEAEVRMGRERAAIAEREQPDLFPTELAIAEEVATEPEVVPAAEPLRVTSQTLDSLAVPASAPIRQEIPEGALLDDPAVSPRTGNPLPITVRERLVTYGRNRGSRALQTNIDNLLQGEPDGVSTKQRVLPTTTQRKPDAARDRASDVVDLQGLGDGAVSKDTVELVTPVTRTVGNVGRSTGRTAARARAESAPLTEETRKDALATELLDLVALPKKNKEQKARLAELKSLALKEVNPVPKRKRSAKEVRETPTDTKPVESESEIDEGVAKIMGRIEEGRFDAAVAATASEKASSPTTSAVRAKIKPKSDEDRARVAEIRKEQGVGLPEANDILAAEKATEASLGTRTIKGDYGTEVPTFGIFGTGGKPQEIDTPLEASVVRALYTGDVKGALEALSKTTPDRRARRVAKKLMEYVGTTKLFLVDPSNDNPASMTAGEAANLSKLFAKERNGELPAGLYVGADNAILLNQRTGINAYTFLHEMAHAATLFEIETNPQSSTVKRLNKLYEDVKATYGKYKPYGTTNLAEFVAEAYSNPEFQRDLARINPKGGPFSAWQKFQEIIAKFFGFDKLGGTAQAEANRLIEAILAPGIAMRGLPNVPAYSTQDGVRKVMGDLAKVKSNLTEKEGRAKIKRDFFSVFGTKNLNPRNEKLIRGLLGVLPNSAVFDDIGSGIPHAKDLGKAILEQRGSLNRSEAAVKAKLDPIVSWASKASETTMKLFNNIVYDSTIDQVDPSISLKEATDRYGQETIDNAGKKLKIDRYKELRKLYDSSDMSADGRRAYVQLRDIYKAINKDLQESLLGRIDSLNIEESAKTSLKNDLFARLLKAANIEPYFPLTRKGKYWLAVRNPADNEVATPTFESLGDRDLAIERFEDMGYDVEVIDPDNMKKYLDNNAPPGSFVAQVLGILNTSNVPAESREQIARLYIESLPESSFSKSLLKREGQLGFDMDAVGAARSKAYDLARQAARIRSSNKIQNEIDKLREATDPKGNKEFRNDRDIALVGEMVDRGNFAISPPADQYAKVANRGAFLWTIGLNASSALVNLSQVPLFAYPMLAGKYGYKAGWDAITGAQKLFVGSYVPHPKERFSNDPEGAKKFGDKYTTPSLDNYYNSTMDDAGNVSYSVRTDLNLDDKKAKELERIKPLIELAAKRGELNSSFLADTLSVDQSGRETSVMDKVTNFSAVMFHNAEVMNRQTTMVAAYDLALNKIAGGKTPTPEQKQEAAEEALHQTQQINGGATLETGPRYAREGIGRVALMYKGYGIQMYYTMLKTGKGLIDTYVDSRVEGGSIPQALAASLKSDMMKQLAGIHLSALFFAGVQGLPLYGAVSMLYDMLQEDYEEDADEALRSYLDNDVLYKGLLSEMTGLDVSQRVKLTDLLFEADRFNSDPSPEEAVGHYFGGPAWSVASRAIEGFGEIMDGEVERGIESMMPGAIRNAYKGLYRYPRDEGILTRRGDPIYDDITGGDMLTQVLGFPPVGYTREIEETSAAKGMESAARSKRQKLLKRYYIATRFGDFDAADAVRDEMDEFNEEEITYIDPKLVITPDTIERSMRRHMSTTTKMHNGVLLSPYMKSAVDDVGFL